MSHACPNCGLTNPDTVAQCDCGYNFQSQEINFINVVQPGDEQARRLPKLWVGFVFAALYFVAIPIEAVIRPDAFKEEHPFGFFVVFFVAGWFYWLFCVYRYHQIMNSIPGTDIRFPKMLLSHVISFLYTTCTGLSVGPTR